jgi:hypothetical protein
MTKLEEMITNAQDKTEQAKRRKIRNKNAEEHRKNKISDSRKFVIGELWIKYFPMFEKLIPGLTKGETAKVFETFEALLDTLSKDETFMDKIRSVVGYD